MSYSFMEASHAAWWDHIAPMLSDEYRVAALDLSGHGDSGRRDTYTLARWAREIVEVGVAAGIDGPPLIVGHSMGGWAAFMVGAEHPDRTAGVVIIDTPIRRVAPGGFRRGSSGPLRSSAWSVRAANVRRSSTSALCPTSRLRCLTSSNTSRDRRCAR